MNRSVSFETERLLAQGFGLRCVSSRGSAMRPCRCAKTMNSRDLPATTSCLNLAEDANVRFWSQWQCMFFANPNKTFNLTFGYLQRPDRKSQTAKASDPLVCSSVQHVSKNIQLLAAKPKGFLVPPYKTLVRLAAFLESNFGRYPCL